MDNACCNEYSGVTRRGLFRGAVALGAAATTTAAYGEVFTETAYAVAGAAGQVLVVLSMRGAADGLSLVVPHGDPVYYQARPSIAVPKASLLVPNEFFGLHPALNGLLPLWSSGRMAAIHATGQPITTRSHFVAMEEVEDADPGSSTRSGWLNRMLGTDGVGSPLEAVQYGSGVPATQLIGSSPVLAANDIDGIKLAGPDAERGRRRKALRTTWGKDRSVLGQAVANAMAVDTQFAPVRATGERPENGAAYPATDLASALRSTARTIRANVGAQIITVDHGSWDHHLWIGKPDNGNLKNMATDFASSVGAFFQDLGPWADRVTLVTISEFGRRVKENANQGLDHGHGNVMFAMGSGVRGGYYGRWPGIANTQDADLPVTIDYRSILSEVIATRFPAASLPAIFPGFQREQVGFML